MADTDSGRPILAMVALQAAVLDRDRVASELRRWVPGAGSLTPNRGGVLTCTVGDELAAIGLMPVPIPWSDLEGPCATAWYWPEAAEAMKRHNAHIIVSLSGGRGDVVARHVLLTRIVAATAAATDAVGIYWGSGTVVNSRERFLAESGRMSESYLPLDLWIDFRVQRLPNGTTRAFTTGLAAFGQMEIEAPATQGAPEDVWELLHLLADYLLTSRETIGDGDTFGRTEDEQIPVHHALSMWSARGTVLRLG